MKPQQDSAQALRTFVSLPEPANLSLSNFFFHACYIAAGSFVLDTSPDLAIEGEGVGLFTRPLEVRGSFLRSQENPLGGTYEMAVWSFRGIGFRSLCVCNAASRANIRCIH